MDRSIFMSVSISGIVEEVNENSILIYIQTDGYPYGANCSVSLDVENEDGICCDLFPGYPIVQLLYHRKQQIKPQQSEVSHMNPKLRIMTIRLMEKMAEHPGYAAWIGIEGYMTKSRPD